MVYFEDKTISTTDDNSKEKLLSVSVSAKEKKLLGASHNDTVWEIFTLKECLIIL